MVEYNNEDRGVAFRNDRKSKPTSPDFRGTVTLTPMLVKQLADQNKAGNPMKMSLAIWESLPKTERDKPYEQQDQSKKYLSISVQLDTWIPKDEYRAKANPVRPEPATATESFPWDD